MESSILNSTKKLLGLGEDYDAFDHDVMTHINTCFFTLSQLGQGPAGGFMIEDDQAIWADYTTDAISLNAVKTYVYLRVRLLFDPPSMPNLETSMREQIKELEYRLQMSREVFAWSTAQ